MHNHARRIAAAFIVGAAAVPLVASAQRDRDRFVWSGTVDAGHTVYVRNLNGPIRIEAAIGNTVEVSALKVVHRDGNPDEVRITSEQRANHGDLVVCALWNDRTRCDEDGYSSRGNGDWNWFDRGRNRGQNVSVEFVVRVPKGVRITASSVNGGLEITGADAEVNAHTVNGSITAHSNAGPVRAHTTNGSLNIRTGQLGNGTLDYQTTNGQITLELPDDASADVELRTVNGSISTDFPLTVDGKFTSRRVRGTIGKGGQTLRLSTVNGSIRLRKA